MENITGGRPDFFFIHTNALNGPEEKSIAFYIRHSFR